MNLQELFQRKSQVGKRFTYGVTPLGKTKAEEFALDGPKWEVLATLNENGPSSVGELASETKMPADKVKRMLGELIKSSYVRRVGADEG